MDSDKKILQTIRRKFTKAIIEYGLIEENDHILIGLSGGKDSLALVDLLGERLKNSLPRFRATAIHVSVSNISYQSDLNYLKNHCEKAGIAFEHRTTQFEDAKKNKSVCFLCSWYRRKALFESAKELNCNKIALGHHLDDSIETLLLNLVFQGSFGSMPPKLKMDKFDTTIIRPLALIQENELLEMERIMNYEKQIKNCPFEKKSSRRDAKRLMLELNKMNPDFRQSIWKALENINPQYLPNKILKKSI
jgi:tRNA(Ile)-lysidine synthase TilS/MesJ